MNNIEIKVQFWKDSWEDLIDDFLKKSFGLRLNNPHLLIDDIITEIEENGFKNLDNKKYYYSILSEYLINDPVINKRLKSKFKILRKVFNSDRTSYILESCKEIKELFQNGLYFENSLDLITDLLTSDEAISIDFVKSLNYLSQGIIVELIKKTYDLEDIKKFVTNIFDNYSFVKENILTTKFPHEIDEEKYINEKEDFKRDDYNKDVINLITNLTLEERIKKLLYYYHKEKEKVFYIFLIEGLKGDIETTIGPVTFYSLEKKQFVKEKSDYDFEDLQHRQGTNKYLQASVEVDFLMPISSKNEAVTKLENALDILACFFNSKTSFYLNDSNYTIINEKGRSIFSSMSRDKRDSILKYQDSLDLNDVEKHLNELGYYTFLWDESRKHNKSTLKIINALHWYRKGEDSLKQEDKMLNYWISIESLFNLEKDLMFDVLNDRNKSKFHLIQETISSLLIFSFIYDYGWELYHYYWAIINNPFITKQIYPDTLIQKAQLKSKTGEKVYLKNFIDNLDEISKYETNLFIIDKINSIKDFYTNSSKTKQIIEEQIKQIKDDVLMIYRFRNLIVHNAHFDNTLLLYYVWKTRIFAGKLIRRIINDFKDNVDLPDIIIKIHLKKEEFLCDFDNGKVNLFKD
jgi:hypothetical protein